MNAIILAGGFATRLWPICEDRPKPLLLLQGKEQISHIVDDIPNHIPVYVSTNAAFEQKFKNWRKRYESERDVYIYVEDAANEDEKMGPVKAIIRCICDNNLQDEDLLIAAGDNYFGIAFDEMLKSFDGRKSFIGSYKLGDINAAKKYGVLDLSDTGDIQGFEEKPDTPASDTIAAALYVLRKQDVQALVTRYKDDPKVYELGDMLSFLMDEHKSPFCAYDIGYQWYDIGSFYTYLEAHKALYNERFKFGKNVEIDAHSEITGASYIGDGAEIYNCFIENSIIFPGCVLKDCVIRNCVIDIGANISGLDASYKLIRKNTHIEASL